MTADDDEAQQVEHLLKTPRLASALESDRFKQFLDHIPIAVAVSELRPKERIVYVNLEFNRVTGQTAAEFEGEPWQALAASAGAGDDREPLKDAVTGGEDYIGSFTIERGDGAVTVDGWSNIIENDDGTPMFRLVALAETTQRHSPDLAEIEQRIRDKDTLLRELQHRVKNNLQLITTLVRLEARNVQDRTTGKRFDRLAGRIEALGLLYRSLSEGDVEGGIDLGVYLSQVASAVMRAHASEGIRLDLKVDTWSVSINIAMPAGLVVNELLTNALKHAFVGREGGTITLHSVVDETGCRVIVADDGVGFAEGVRWPQPGKLSALIVQSLRQNAKSRVTVDSTRDKGVRVTIFFARADAAPEAS